MLPFTRDQFLGVFAEYNYHAAVWPAQFVAYALGLAMVLLIFHPSAAMRRTLNAALALMWLWTGIAYHWLHFAPINPVAIGFGLLFVLQGLAFAQAALTGRGPGYAPVEGASGMLGWQLLVVPVAWSLVGGSAALVLGMEQDWPLLVGGVATVAALWLRGRTHRPALAAA